MSKAAKVLSKCVNGTQIVSIRGYKKTGHNDIGYEINDYSIVMGFNTQKMKAIELTELKAFNVGSLQGHTEIALQTALSELIASRVNEATNAHVQGQLEAYDQLAKGVKLHCESGSVKVSGLLLRKKNIFKSPDFTKKPEPAEPKTEKAQLKRNVTLAKRAIESAISKKNKNCFRPYVMFTLEKECFSIAMQKTLIE